MFNLFKNTTIFILFLVFFIPLQKGLFIAADMKKILKVDNPNDFARFVEAPELHPLVSVIHYDEVSPFRHSLNNYGVYGLFIQRQFPKILSYGMRTMQASDASIIAVEPGQLGGLEDNGERISLSGWALLGRPNCCMAQNWNARSTATSFFPTSSPTRCGWSPTNGTASPS